MFLRRTSWVQKYPHFWFLPCNPGSVHATYSKFLSIKYIDCQLLVIDTQGTVRKYVKRHGSQNTYDVRERSIRSIRVSMDQRRTGKFHSFVNTMGLVGPMAYVKGSFVRKTQRVPRDPRRIRQKCLGDVRRRFKDQHSHCRECENNTLKCIVHIVKEDFNGSGDLEYHRQTHRNMHVHACLRTRARTHAYTHHTHTHTHTHECRCSFPDRKGDIKNGQMLQIQTD